MLGPGEGTNQMSVRKRAWTTGKGEKKEAWLVDYVDQAGGRHIKTFGRKREADAYHASVRVDVRKGVHTPENKSITVAEAAEDWLDYIESEGRERSTLDQYKQHVRLHIVPRIGGTKLAHLTTPFCEKFRDELVRDLSRPMARKVLGSLKAILKDAKRRGNVTTNVAADTTIKAKSREKRKVKAGVDFPLPDEVRRMLGAVDGRSRALLIVGAFAGLRSSELRGLRWTDVSFQGSKIRVEQRIDRYQQVGRPKSEAGDREVPVMPIVVNTLREAKKAAPKGELVFANGAGNPENHANLVQRVLHSAQIKAGVVTAEKAPKYTGLHTLRHYFAAWSLTTPDHGGQGLTLKELQEQLGHATLAMTADTYGHLLPPQEETVRTRLENAQAKMFPDGLATQTRHAG
jgi:integrase